MIEIEKAPPFATVQDLGWPTGRAIGLPQGGAMDPLLLARANSLVGNPGGTAAIEWALGTGTLRLDTEARLAVQGAGQVQVDGVVIDPGHPVIHATAGARISIVPDPLRRFAYVTVRGGIDVPAVLGSRSTYLPGGFGGLEGRRLRSGDQLPVGPADDLDVGTSIHPRGQATQPAGSPPAEAVLRVSRGPQWDHFEEPTRRLLFEGGYVVSASSDRMGYRLSGPAITPRLAATLPSEAACAGAVQIPGDGQPIVIMPDGPTVGGYPKIAVVLHADLRLLAQCVPGRTVRFREVSLERTHTRDFTGPEKP